MPQWSAGSGRTHDPSVFRGCYDGKDQSGKAGGNCLYTAFKNLRPVSEKRLPAARSDGDLLILDPSKEWVLTHSHMHSAVDYTAYEGMKIRGSIDW